MKVPFKLLAPADIPESAKELLRTMEFESAGLVMADIAGHRTIFLESHHDLTDPEMVAIRFAAVLLTPSQSKLYGEAFLACNDTEDHSTEIDLDDVIGGAL